MPTAPLTWHRMNSGRLKVALLARTHYTFRAFQKGLSPLWSAVQFIALVVGGSAVAYLAVALDKPLFAIVLFLLGALITAGEGAFRLNKASEAELAKADETILEVQEGAPRLSFGRAVIPQSSQPYELQWGDGETFIEQGRVIRVPVQNEPGSGPAMAVQARLTFQPMIFTAPSLPSTPSRASGMNLTAPLTRSSYQVMVVRDP
jgi:hypothetical protein